MSQHAREIRRELLAEFLGTFILIVFGVGVVAQFVLSRGTAGSYLAINLVWGLGVTMGCYVGGRHLRRAPQPGGHPRAGGAPRVSLAQGPALRAGAAGRRVRRVGGGLPDVLRGPRAFDGGVRQVLGPQGTAGIWATYPQPFLSTLPGGFIDQVVGTALLMAVICALTDARNTPPGAGLAPVIVGLLVVAIGAAFGFNSGLCHQPGARFRAAPVHGAGRLGDGGLPGGQRLVVGARGRASCRGRARRMALRRLHRWAVSAQPGHRRRAEAAR